MRSDQRETSMQGRNIERRLAAILHADAYGSSRLISEDELGTLQVLTPALAMMRDFVRQHGGHSRLQQLLPNQLVSRIASLPL